MALLYDALGDLDIGGQSRHAPASIMSVWSLYVFSVHSILFAAEHLPR